MPACDCNECDGAESEYFGFVAPHRTPAPDLKHRIDWFACNLEAALSWPLLLEDGVGRYSASCKAAALKGIDVDKPVIFVPAEELSTHKHTVLIPPNDLLR